jgi:hypothetical protein
MVGYLLARVETMRLAKRDCAAVTKYAPLIELHTKGKRMLV